MDITITPTETISGDLQVQSYQGMCSFYGKWTAHIVFRVVAAGAVIKTYDMVYDIASYNSFWTSFTCGRYLVEQLKIKYPELASVTIPDDIEDSFVNHS